jgi:hypothetical protein
MISTSKLLSGIEREFRALVAEMELLTDSLLAAHPDAGLTVRRTPTSRILQAGEVGVSMSLFRSRAGEAAGAEIVIAEWRGEITQPGTPRRDGCQATQVSTRSYQIHAHDETSWVWTDATTASDTALSSRALAATYVDAMALRLSQVMPAAVE